MQVTTGGKVPTILGVEFWDKHKAVFDFRQRAIMLIVNGRSVKVPFTIGDENSPENELAVYSVDDVVVEPGQPYLVRGEVQSAAATRRTAELISSSVWHVQPWSDEENAAISAAHADMDSEDNPDEKEAKEAAQHDMDTAASLVFGK